MLVGNFAIFISIFAAGMILLFASVAPTSKPSALAPVFAAVELTNSAVIPL